MKPIYIALDAGKASEKEHPQKKEILKHLRTCRVVAAVPGILRDAFTGDSVGGEFVLRTNGRYEWTTELVYHFDRYNVQLPDDFVDFVLKNNVNKFVSKQFETTKKQEFDYTIESEASEEEFYRICHRIENMPGVVKDTLLTDVDGSQIQYYRRNGKTIKVYNDYYVGAIYVKSEEPIVIF